MDQTTFPSPEVRVVEASAGSGKTYALAKRYLQLVLDPAVDLRAIPIRRILALTFTNKATFEMKARILDFLKKTAFGQLKPEDEESLLEPLGLDARQASRRAFAVMEDIIRHYNYFQVQTIDTFINAILSGCAMKINLTANFRIRTNAADYLHYSLDALIDRAAHEGDVRRLFEEFLHHYLYLENRSGWFPKNDMLTIIATLFAKNNTYGLPFSPGLFSPADVIKNKAAILEAIRSLRGELPDGMNAGFVKSLDKFLLQHAKIFDIDKVPDYFARPDIPANKGTVVPASVDKTWAKIHRSLRSLCEEEAVSLFNPYIHVFLEVLDEFYAQSSRDDCLFLNELNKRAGALFEEGGVSVQELYYRLATRFRHYLIDEFQDTSRLQWGNLALMAEEALSSGGTLFYVGDRKQAIYGFRGGDAALFDEIKQAFAKFDVRTDLLVKNWRSRENIVTFNNDLFSVANLTRFIRQKEARDNDKTAKTAPVFFTDEDLRELERVFASAQQEPRIRDGAGYVRIEAVAAGKREERDEVIREKLLGLVRDLRSRFAYRDIAILTRGNKDIEVITSWLLEEDIPVESERTSDIRANGVITELMALLTFLDSPIDNLAFASFICGEIFTRATGLTAEEMNAFIFHLRERRAGEKDLYLYAAFRERYPEVWAAYLDGFFRNVGLYPLYELAVTVYSRFNVLTHCREAQGFLMHFLELIKKVEEEHTDVASFLGYFEELEGDDLYVTVADSDAVRVMTIHKSKGLEFPVVILPFLTMDVKTGDKGGDYQPSFVMREQEGRMALLRLKSKYYKYSDRLYAIYADEYKKALMTELNSLYVAMTRPEHELYAFIPEKSGNSLNIARLLIPEELYERGQPQRYEPQGEKAGEDVMIDMAPSDYPDWIGFLKDEFLSDDQWRKRQQMREGEIIHAVLAGIGHVHDADAAIARALVKAEQRFPEERDWSKDGAKVRELLKRPETRRFFDCAGAQVFTEREAVTASGLTKRCDRLIVTGQDVWVIDYKSTRDDEAAHRAQIEEYKRIFGGLYPGKTVKGYLVYLDEFSVEDV